MKQLHKLQQNFQNYVLGPGEKIVTYVDDQQLNFAKTRLSIYKKGYHLRLIEVLQKDYPGVFALLGEDRFKEMTTQYIDKRPSKYYSVSLFGEGIPGFLKQTLPYSKQSELAEMAAFELALNRSIDTVDAPALFPEDIAKISQENWPLLKIKPHPSLQILKIKWNIPDIWQAISEKTSLPELVKGQTNTWVVWRQEIKNYYMMLNTQESFIIQSMQKNLPVAKICEGLCRWFGDEQVPQYLVSTILRWLQEKLLSEIYL